MILSCESIAKRIKREVKSDLAKLKSTPHLISVQVGDSKEATIYASAQKKIAKEVGIKYSSYHFKEISQKALINFIQKLNKDSSVNGIIIHLPLPFHINAKSVFICLDIKKDVEGMHTQSNIIPCTPLAVMEILKEVKVRLRGKEVVIIGSSDCVGKPLLNLISDKMATLTICNIATRNLLLHTQRADILIVAVGKPNFIKPEMVKEGVIVIDVGINRVGNEIIGDVDKKVGRKAKFLTPVPGGVGLITTAMLMKNSLICFRKQ